MRRFVLLNSAAADLTAILTYITKESGNRSTGRTFVDALRTHCRKLAALPGTLPCPPRTAPRYPQHAFSRLCHFLPLYRDRLEVINILNAHKDIAAHFEE